VIKIDGDFLSTGLSKGFKLFSPKVIERIARGCQFIRRKRKLKAVDFLKVLVFDSHDFSLEGQACKLTETMSREALHQRFTPAAAAFLERCLSWLLHNRVCSRMGLILKQISFCRRLLVMDSTIWAVAEKLAHAFKGSGGDAPAASCKLQLVLEVLSGQIHCWRLSGGSEPDQNFGESIIDFLQSRDLLLFDLGYFKLQFLKLLTEKGVFFLTRLLFGCKIVEAATRKPITTSDFSKTDCTENQVIIGTGKSAILCRLICFPVPQEVADERRRRLRANRRRMTGKTPIRERLKYCNWTVFVTNISAANMPASTLKILYTLRWQIEIFFKILKSILKLKQIHTGNQNRLRCHVLGRLILAVLISHVYYSASIHLCTDNQIEISYIKLAKRLQFAFTTFYDTLASNTRRAITVLGRKVLKILNYCLKRKQKSRQSSLEQLCNAAA
jgi:hypothetical protein